MGRARGHGWWPDRVASCKMAVAACGLLVLAGSSSATAQGNAGGRRVALVVGNDAYSTQGALANAVNDARAVANALTEVGFSVTKLEDASRARLTSALGDFARSLRDDDVALFYFAGHGVQVDQENYLLPTDYAGQTATALRLDAIRAMDVQDMLRPARVAMLVFDACRNNPYRSVRSGGGGLAPMEARGTLIAYAAGAGEVAEDAPQSANGLFTGKFVEALGVPGLTATGLFRRVRRDVYTASNAEQWPAVYDDLLSDFVFRPAVSASAGPAGDARPGAVADTAAATARLQQETVFWESIQGSGVRADFEAFLEQFPNGTFAGLARNRLAALGASAVERPAPDPPRRTDPPRPDPVRPRPWRAGEAFRDCPTCPELVVVPAGTFRMGCVSRRGCVDDELPVRDVQVASFALSKHEVTFEEYARFAAATGRRRPSDWGWGGGSRPVTGVSWEDAAAYANWLSNETGERYRLPSEAEWEYAARAGTRTAYSWGQNIGRNRANCDGCGSRWDDDAAAPVGSFPANAWGLHDMHGNVSEWVADCWHESYARAPGAGSAWLSGGDCRRRVLRGGSWLGGSVYLRSAKRGRMDTSLRYANVGFRVARTAGS